MNSGAKLAAFAAVIVAVFGAAMAVGAAVGPLDVGDDDAHQMASSVDAPSLPRGLAVAQDGYRLVLVTDSLPADADAPLAFRIVDDRGAAVTAFEQLHERPLHLIVLARDLVGYHHLHPTMDAAGEWTVGVPALRPGSYRVFADFQPRGADNITLGTDLRVTGATEAVALPVPADVAVVDGLTVTLGGSPAVGDVELTFVVQADGEPVRTDPYLGAAGHLVAIRAGDLAYLHVHPHDTTGGTAVTFTGEFPSAGTYRLFFDFSYGGVVRTAAFTVVVPDELGVAMESTMPTHDGDH
jgi:hypothetical protein